MMTSAIGAMGTAEPNFSTIAGLYSQLAGVLAGFAFAGLVALIVAQFNSGSRPTSSFQSFVPLISSFICLVGTSLDYAIIAGEGSGDKRAAVLETVGGLAFSVAGVMLFYSLLVLLHGAQADAVSNRVPTTRAGSAVAFTRWTLVVGVAPSVIVLLEGGVADQEAARYGADTGLHWLDDVSIALLGLVLAFAIYRSWQTRKLTAASTPPSPSILSAAAVAIALVCVSITSTFGVYASADTIGPDAVRLAEILILSSFDFAVIWAATKYR